MGPSKQRILKNIITIFDVPAHDEDSIEALHGGKRRVYVKKKWGGGGGQLSQRRHLKHLENYAKILRLFLIGRRADKEVMRDRQTCCLSRERRAEKG